MTSALENLLGRAAEVALTTFVLVGFAALVVFLGHGEVPTLVLPVATAIAIGMQWWRRGRTPSIAPVAGDRAWLLGATVLLLGVAVLLTWGALATASRTWDGAAMWDPKAALLAARMTLEQTAFRDAGVYLHSRDYPLLQPVLVAAIERLAGCGRVLFPLVFVVHCTLLFTVLRRVGAGVRAAAIATVGFALTPMVLSPGGGGVDSGYAEALLSLAVTASIGGLVTKDRLLVGVGIALLAWTKPEGGLYASVVVMLAWLGRERRLVMAATASWAIAMTLWLVLQRDLQSFGRGSFAWSIPLVLALVGAVVVASHRLLASSRAKWFAVAVVVVVAAMGVPFLLRYFEVGGGVFAGYLRDPARLLERLTLAPQILGGVANWAWLRGRFGIAFVLVVVVALCARNGLTREPLRWLACMVVVVALPFLLAPFDDLAGHLRATMPRLLCHHLGVAWLVVGLAWVGVPVANATQQPPPVVAPLP